MTNLTELKAIIAGAKPVLGFDGYVITEDGDVYSTKANWRGYGIRKLNAHVNEFGYLTVRMIKDGHRYTKRVHVLMAESWIGPKPSDDYQVCHGDGVKLNNHKNNIRWGTAKDNADDRDKHGRTYRGEDNGFSKLKEVDVIQIKKDRRSNRKIASEFNVNPSTIDDIKNGVTWSWM